MTRYVHFMEIHFSSVTDTSRQTINIGPALERLRVHWPNIVPYMGTHWANFPGLSGYICYYGESFTKVRDTYICYYGEGQ